MKGIAEVGPEPARWSDDPEGRPLGADVLLRGARRPQPARERDLERLAASIAAIGRPAIRSWRPMLAMAAAVVLTVSLVGTALAVWRRSGVERAVAPAMLPLPPGGESAAASRRAAPAPALAPVVAPAPASVAARPKAGAAVRQRRAAPAPAPAAPVTVADTLAQETALIDAARAEAARSPALALQLLERHGTEFPDGQLAPEREFLAVEALSRLGRHGEATQRAAALKRRAPHSSYAARAERLLEGARRQAWQQ